MFCRGEAVEVFVADGVNHRVGKVDRVIPNYDIGLHEGRVCPDSELVQNSSSRSK